MQKLINRHDLIKYKDHDIIFVSSWCEGEPIQITENDFEKYSSSCGDFYIITEYDINDTFYFIFNLKWRLAKILKIGKRNLKFQDLGNSEQFKVPVGIFNKLISNHTKELKVKVVEYEDYEDKFKI